MRKKRKMIPIILLLIFFGLHLGLRSRPLAAQKMISHRGAAGLAPENTLAGIQLAIDHQAPLIEVDVQRSKDNVLLLIHDRSIDRTTNGRGAVKDLTWAEIKQLDASNHFADRYANEPIPSLDEALTLIEGQNTRLVIELKSASLYPNIEKEIREAIMRRQMESQAIIISFNGHTLQKINHPSTGSGQAEHHLPTGLLTLYPLRLANPSTPPIVSVFWPSVILDPTLIYRAHQQERQVWVWTVNNAHLMRLLLWLGVDGITTDRPDVFNEVVD